jgi:hypothetical protein
MKRSKDINIYEIRLEGTPPWNIDLSSLIPINFEENKNLLKYDYARFIIPNNAIRKLISFNEFLNFINDGINSSIVMDYTIGNDGVMAVYGYLKITAVNDNIISVEYAEV